MINSREEKKICVLQLWMYKKYMECFEHASWNKVSVQKRTSIPLLLHFNACDYQI